MSQWHFHPRLWAADEQWYLINHLMRVDGGGGGSSYRNEANVDPGDTRIKRQPDVPSAKGAGVGGSLLN